MRVSLIRCAASRRVAMLAGCASSTFTTATAPTEAEDSQLAASPSNIASLSGVVQRNPNDPQAVNMRGTVFGQAGRNQEALADFNKAISLDPNYTQAYANRALIYRKTGKLDLALADYNKALELDQNYAVAYIGRGIVYRQQQQTLNAFNDFNKAIAIRPDSAQAYYNRGLLYQSQRQHRFAIDDFSTSIGLAQNEADPFIARALSYMSINDFKAAAADLDDAVSADPQNLQAWTSRGLAYERLGDKERAAGSYAKALNIKKDHEPAKAGFARLGGQLGPDLPDILAAIAPKIPGLPPVTLPGHHAAFACARAVSHPRLPLPVAGRPAGLVGVRDGDADPRLVRAGRDRLGALPDGLRRPALRRHADRADDRRGERPRRPPQPAVGDARDLRDGGGNADGAGLRRRAQPVGRPDPRRGVGAGAAFRHGAARRGDRRHHAAATC